MDVLDVIKGRRSIRAYENRDVPAKIVENSLKQHAGLLQLETFSHGSS